MMSFQRNIRAKFKSRGKLNFSAEISSYRKVIRRWTVIGDSQSGEKNITNMDIQIQKLIEKAYAAFNTRDIDAALTTFHSEVQWPKAFEGGYVKGHDEVRKYWTRQWSEINPHVEPIEFAERKNGTIEVRVHQIVKDLQGALIFDGIVKHIYIVRNGLLQRMDIELL